MLNKDTVNMNTSMFSLDKCMCPHFVRAVVRDMSGEVVVERRARGITGGGG